MANAAIKYVDEEQEQYLAAREYFDGELHSIITESIGMVSASKAKLIDKCVTEQNSEKLGELLTPIIRSYVVKTADYCQKR